MDSWLLRVGVGTYFLSRPNRFKWGTENTLHFMDGKDGVAIGPTQIYASQLGCSRSLGIKMLCESVGLLRVTMAPRIPTATRFPFHRPKGRDVASRMFCVLQLQV